jgi:transcription elongation factor GreA
MNTRGIYMTVTGLQRAKALLDRRGSEYDAICKERAVAHELSGDGWHDNPHFNRLQQLEADKSREIAVLKAVIGVARLVVIDPAHRPTDAVRIGSLVRIVARPKSTGEEYTATWEIVGYDETDMAESKLAYNSPLGAALIGKEEGELVDVSLAGGEAEVSIDCLLEASIAGT